jgi:hypothetical protein|tara:strand:- start:328 stop:555 length:228 start_codon:yes stop_codon:yes gene_type:complete
MKNRREFLSMFGVSAAGTTFAGTLQASKKIINEGGEEAKAEIERLKQAYEDLDKRSKLIIRLVLFMSGLDFIAAL